MAAKRRIVEPDHARLSVRRQCELFGLSLSSYYRRPAVESGGNLKLMRLIDEEYTRHPFYGSRRMTTYLRRLGHAVNRKRVSRLMRVMGLAAVSPRGNTSKPSPEHKVYPYLLRGLEIVRRDQVWCSDITYIPMARGFAYLTAVMDWHSRYVLSWEVSVTMNDDFCVSALERAIRRYGTPEIFNTDQGSQFTGAAFTGVLSDNGIRMSMDGKGRAIDNVMIERLWRTVKYEDIYIKEHETVAGLVESLRSYFEFYNNLRPHQSLGNRTPAEVYHGLPTEESAGSRGDGHASPELRRAPLGAAVSRVAPVGTEYAFCGE